MEKPVNSLNYLSKLLMSNSKTINYFTTFLVQL